MFDPTFNLGHVLTVTVIIAGVGGGVLALRDSLQQGIIGLAAENKMQDQRLEATSKELTRSQAEDAAFRAEIRQSLTQLSAAISDLRVVIAKMTPDQSRK